MHVASAPHGFTRFFQNLMDVDDDLIFNLMQDFKKKNIHPVQRAKFLKAVLEDKNISQRELSRKLDVPHSTMQDWISYGDITEKEYNEMIEKGVSKKDLYNAVRNDRTHKDKNIKILQTRYEIDVILNNTIDVLKPLIKNNDATINTKLLLQELRDVINRIELHIERKK